MPNLLTLWITSIGDLLINNKISRKEDGNLIDGIKLNIPEYQRPYKWSAKNVSQLIDDILQAKSENKDIYRVGTLILHEVNPTDKIFDIVDGQQRTITFALPLTALGVTEIAFLNQKLSSISYNTFNVANNYRVLERRIKNIQDAKELRDLQEYVKNSCELIVVATNNISEAFQFFDSQNTRGKKLYPHDLLKAYHLREMNSFEISETEEIVKNGKSWIGRNFRICFKSTYIV